MNRAAPIHHCRPPDTRSRGWVSFVGFALFTSAGMATLACAVLLPEYAGLTDLQTQRDGLAHQVGCDRRLADYNDRLLGGMRVDPVLRGRLAIQHRNYRPTQCRTVQVPEGPASRAPARIAMDARIAPAPQPPRLVRAGRWLDDRQTRTGLIVLSLGMLALAMLLFGPPHPPD